MPRVIIMDRELHEPLTIIDVPLDLHPEGRFKGFNTKTIMLALPPPPIDPRMTHEQDYLRIQNHVTKITFERVCRSKPDGGSEILFWYAYAEEPEFALKLRAAFLPGQLSEVHAREQRAYFKGLFEGVGLL